MKGNLVLVLAIATACALDTGAASGLSPLSKTITEVLREPLPPEDLTCSTEASEIVVQGPTFRYSVDMAVPELEVNEEEKLAGVSDYFDNGE